MAFSFLFSQVQTVDARPNSLAPIVEKTSPAVVNITTKAVIEGQMLPRGIVPEGSPFEDFFRNFRDQNNLDGRPRRSSALGSGFIISEDGFVVTNNHVIERADEISVEFLNGDTLEATVVGRDRNTDIALLKVNADDSLPFVSFGDSDSSLVGDWVFAIGNPLGQGFSTSVGIVSARNRALSGSYDDYIQTDAAINRGNSGGPLFNMDGEVIGVNTAILSPNGGSIGIGFSMASNVVSQVIDQLLEYGETRRGWLGVRIQEVTPDVADALGLNEVKGALVSDVPDGPARIAGMKTGDVILTFDGKDIKDTRGLVRQVGNTEVGKTVKVIVHRNEQKELLEVTLGRREDEERAFPVSAVGPESKSDPVQKEVLGLSISILTPELATELDVSDDFKGLVVTDVDPASEAYEKGVRAGDIITEAGQQEVTTPNQFDEQIADARKAGRKSLLLLVRRSNDPRFVALDIDN
ncbi:MAG: Do family serine endopeptidase [Aestuariivita sp.]|nr:Do family serine endopeptidase [Aestuariivita sp.]